MVSINKNIDLTPQESEQLSVYASDDSFVSTTKEDLQELTSMFREMMGDEDAQSDSQEEYIKDFKEHFTPQSGVNAVYRMLIDGKKKPLVLEVNGPRNNFYYGNVEEADVDVTISKETLDDIVYARMTFQRAFMGGLIKIKGDFKMLRALDQLFTFMEEEQYV